MIRSLIIEDERRSREVLSQLITKVPGLEIVGEADNVDKGLEMIIKLKPDLIFLDIKCLLRMDST
jgi:response regulator of citrate/malate metabolism